VERDGGHGSSYPPDGAAASTVVVVGFGFGVVVVVVLALVLVLVVGFGAEVDVVDGPLVLVVEPAGAVVVVLDPATVVAVVVVLLSAVKRIRPLLVRTLPGKPAGFTKSPPR
jgi:hypothetical protein